MNNVELTIDEHAQLRDIVDQLWALSNSIRGFGFDLLWEEHFQGRKLDAVLDQAKAAEDHVMEAIAALGPERVITERLY